MRFMMVSRSKNSFCRYRSKGERVFVSFFASQYLSQDWHSTRRPSANQMATIYHNFRWLKISRHANCPEDDDWSVFSAATANTALPCFFFTLLNWYPMTFLPSSRRAFFLLACAGTWILQLSFFYFSSQCIEASFEIFSISCYNIWSFNNIENSSWDCKLLRYWNLVLQALEFQFSLFSTMRFLTFTIASFKIPNIYNF